MWIGPSGCKGGRWCFQLGPNPSTPAPDFTGRAGLEAGSSRAFCCFQIILHMAHLELYAVRRKKDVPGLSFKLQICFYF